MAGPKIDDNLFGELGEMLKRDEQPKGKKKDLKPWSPSLSATQQKIFDCASPYVLLYGNRGGGKSYISGHKMVRHAWENENALVLIIVGVRSQATQGGIWEKLATEILPLWKDGIGLDYKEESMDEQRYRYRYVANRHGGWSKIVLMSLPWGEQIRRRIRGFEPSFVFVDEITTLDTPDYFDAVSQQVGRRPGIAGVQQYMAACNPEGPSHWVYKRFFEMPFQEVLDQDGVVISKEGEWDERYCNFLLQFEENKDNLPKVYYQGVVEAVRNDPIEYRRMVEGEWVDRPSGDALFKEYYDPEVCVKGDGHKRILPIPKYPIIMGYDLGTVNNAIVFLQAVPTMEKVVWLAFDEIIHTNKKMPYPVLVRQIMRRMYFWNRRMSNKFHFHHISDNSAFNQYRAASGSYDVLDVERISSEMCGNFDLDPIKMKPAPKFSGSVESRTRLMMGLLMQQAFFVDKSCERLCQMFLSLQSSKSRKGDYDPTAAFKPKRSVHLHGFDALTYPIISGDVNSSFLGKSAKVESEMLAIGVGVV